MKTTQDYTLHRLTKDVFAFVHPEGPWGINNAGLICDGENASVLVDTLFTTGLTREMIDAMAAKTAAARHIETVLNTHANGDHCWGNNLFEGKTIISSEAAAEEMKTITPELMVKLMKVARIAKALGPMGRGLGNFLSNRGKEPFGSIFRAAPYLVEIFGDFDFAGIKSVLPTQTFTEELTITVGAKKIRLLELGPAHTSGDFVVFVPEDRVLFAGDLLFNNSHPLLWEGPAANWIAACDKMIALDPEHVVPGHGPLCDVEGLRRQRDYFVRLTEQARLLFDAGVPLFEAAERCDLGPLDVPAERERLVLNIDTLYRSFRDDPPRASVVPCFPLMADRKRDILVR